MAQAAPPPCRPRRHAGRHHPRRGRASAGGRVGLRTRPLSESRGRRPGRRLPRRHTVRRTRRHYDMAAMRRAETYLLPESDAEVPADLATLQHRYEELTRFFSAAASAGDAVALMLA
nr:DUF1877 family protein [Streptomyces glaucescens]